VGPRRHDVLDGCPDLHMGKGNFEGRKGRRPFVKYRDTLQSRVNTAEPIEMPFWLWARMGCRNHVLSGGAEGRCHCNQFCD